MILSNTSSPNKSLYIIGANILHILDEYEYQEISMYLLYKKYNELHGDISFSYVLFGLDWLFILNKVSVSSTGEVLLCN